MQFLQMATYLSTDDFEDADMLTPEEESMAPQSILPRVERAYAAHALHAFNASNEGSNNDDLDLGVTRDWLVY